jgi:hypothetical protein
MKMMMNSLEELRQEYLSNFYAHKIQQIENKEEVLEKTKWLLKQISDLTENLNKEQEQ